MTNKTLDQRLDEMFAASEDLSDIIGEAQEEEKELYVNPMNVPVVYKKQESAFLATGDLHVDYTYSRDILYGLIDRGQRALENALQVAVQTEHPRALEVANGLIKTLADLTKQMLDMQKTVKDILEIKPQGGNPQSKDEEGDIKGNTFVVTNTTDLQRVLHNLNKKENVIDAEVIKDV